MWNSVGLPYNFPKLHNKLMNLIKKMLHKQLYIYYPFTYCAVIKSLHDLLNQKIIIAILYKLTILYSSLCHFEYIHILS